MKRNVDFLKEIGSRIKIARQLSVNYNYSKEVASNLGIPATTYSQYENGSRTIPFNVLYQIAKLLNVNYSWLVAGSLPITMPFNRKYEEKFYQECDKQNIAVKELKNIDNEEQIITIDLFLLIQIIKNTIKYIDKSNDSFTEIVIEIYNMIAPVENIQKSQKKLVDLTLKSLQMSLAKVTDAEKLYSITTKN